MSSGANLFSLTGVGRLGFGSDRGGAGWCTGGTKITFEARMQLMTLMALMLEITTSTSTTTMELSAVTMGDENRVSPPPHLMAWVVLWLIDSGRLAGCGFL